MARSNKFLGVTSDGRQVRIFYPLGDPNLLVAVQGHKGVRSLPKTRQEAVLMGMSRMTAEQLVRKLW